jgi:Type III restriction enzyme, res subunit
LALSAVNACNPIGSLHCTEIGQPVTSRIGGPRALTLHRTLSQSIIIGPTSSSASGTFRSTLPRFAAFSARSALSFSRLVFAFALRCFSRALLTSFKIARTPRAVTTYPSPAEFWQRYRGASGLQDQTAADRLLTPSNYAVGKGERYYQQIAINRSIEAILTGRRRLLITMATGTGKTTVAF